MAGRGGVGDGGQSGGPSQAAHGAVGVGRHSEGPDKELSGFVGDLLANGS